VIALVVAYASNGVIGRDGGLPWRLPSDMRHFRELTEGSTVLMGRRTWESIPDRFRPLPNRRNLVLSGDRGYAAPGAEVFAGLDAALQACGRECFVIGGAQTYAESLELAERVHATEIDTDIDGDTFFPALDPAGWRRVRRGERVEENGHGFRLCVYERAA
jgi:dihydrofolate reductase